MQKNLTQKDSILKWVQIEKERVPIHPSDKESPVPRSFIFKDFTIYFMCYLIPPLTLVLNKFADYPLEFYNHPVPKYIFNKVKQRLKTGESKEVDLDIQNHFCTLIWTGLSTFVLFFTMFVTYYTNMHLFENRFFMIQKLGTPVIYLLRCFANSYIAASNEPLYDFNYLSNFPVFMADEMDKEEENNLTGLINTRASSRYTALEFYSYVTSQINYDPKLSFRTGYHLTGLSVFISLIPLILSLTMRQTSSSGFESFLVFANFLISFPISVVLLRGFMHSFSLYQSMKRTMERLINSTYSEKFIAEKTIAQNPSSDEEKVVLNLTHPDNLRAYFYTHGALTKRENSLESRLISLTASLIAVMSILMLSIISLNFFFGNQGSTNKIMQFAENNSGEIAKRMVGDILNLKDVDLMIMGYLVFVLVLAMIFIASLGSGYNFAAKNAQAQYLYEVYLSATLELQCDGWNEKRMSKQRKGQLETVIKLVEAMTKHFENHVNDLGILGFSYSSLYWYIFAFFSANAIGIIRRQISL